MAEYHVEQSEFVRAAQRCCLPSSRGVSCSTQSATCARSPAYFSSRPLVGQFGVPAEDGGEDVRDLGKPNVVGLHGERGVNQTVQSGRLLLAVVVVIGPARRVVDQVCDVGEAALVVVEHEHGAALVSRLGLVSSLELQCDVACAGQAPLPASMSEDLSSLSVPVTISPTFSKIAANSPCVRFRRSS